VLGLPIVRDQRDSAWAEASLAGGVRFALHSAHEGAQPQTPGTAIIDFAVSDVEEAERRLRDAGVTIVEVMRETWGSAVSALDPDGYRISLYQSPPR
jgi:predicted enzyme related to lactoylglutathione lyase